jgi:hypothetical protein
LQEQRKGHAEHRLPTGSFQRTAARFEAQVRLRRIVTMMGKYTGW